MSILAIYLTSIGTHVHGSTGSNNQCDVLVNQSCPAGTAQVNSENPLPNNSETEADTTQTPLLLPDLSPTREDLNKAEVGERAKISDANDDNDISTSIGSDDEDDESTEDNAADNSGNEEETNDGASEDNDGRDYSDGNRHAFIPFP